MMATVKNNLLLLCGFLYVFLFAPISSVTAGEFTVRPFLIDEVTEPRGVINETAKLTNSSTYRKYVVYATVNEITVDKEGEIREFTSPVMTDRTVTVTSWVEVTRGRIEIPPGEEREVPITFRINPKAEPGDYHVFIGFVPAPNRPAAEKIARAGEADGIVVKITVADQRKNTLRVNGFMIDRFVMGESDRLINIAVENIGDITSAPSGEIIFYDSRGAEVQAIPVNTGNETVEPGETITLTGTVPLGDSLGRYKANLSLFYGDGQRAALHDTAVFYMMPFHLILLVLFGIVVVSLLVAYLFKRAFLQEEFHDGTDEVTMYVRDGHDAEPQDHDIDLKNNSK